MKILRENWPILSGIGTLGIAAIVYGVTLRADVDHEQSTRKRELQFVQAEIVDVKKKQSDQQEQRRKLNDRLRNVEKGVTELKTKADAAKEQRDRIEDLLRRAVNRPRR